MVSDQRWRWLLAMVGLVWLGACDAGESATSAAASPEPAASPQLAAPPEPKPKLEPPTAPEKAPHFVVSEQVVTTTTGRGEGPYVFTASWHAKVIPSWERVLAAHVGQPDLDYLEIGVFEGRSLVWMLEEVLTHSSARATAVDVFMGDYEARFDANIAAWGASVGAGAPARVTKLTGPSGRVLRAMADARFEIIYIDGSHLAADVLADAVLCWDLLELGGLLIFDDYGWKGRPKGAAIPHDLRPALAIDAFVAAHHSELEIVERGYQVIVRKIPNPCVPRDYCTPVGDYQYYWRDLELRRADGSVVALSPVMREQLEALVLASPPGSFEPPASNAQLRALLDRLEREQDSTNELSG